MSYSAAVGHLYARGLELAPSTPSATPRKFDLDHMRILARALGNPQNSFPSILLAGTNGKGSTAATLASILQAAGYRTALYTSPHLSRVNERIQINGTPISDDDFARLYFRVDSAGERLVADGQLPNHPSFFEVLTALAFLYFSGSPTQNPVISTGGPQGRSGETRFSASDARPVDIAILEVGMGGRLDATNIVSPLLSIITDISLDHQDYLGHTITEITREKAGILRPNGILITLPQHPEANQAIGEAAQELDLHGINAAQYIPTAEKLAHREDGIHNPSSSGSVILSERSESKDLRSLLPRNQYTLTLAGEPLHIDSPLIGQHQQRNIALAIGAAEALRNLMSYNPLNSNQISYNITNQAIEEGIRNTRWPGRLELLPLGNSAILLDVAHNPAGAWTLRDALSHLPDDLPRTLIFSCLRDKDIREMSQILLPLFDSSSSDRPQDHILFAPINSPRAASLEELSAAASDLDIPALTVPSVAEALAEARSITPPNGLIVATGSIYLVGELRSLILAEANHSLAKSYI